MNLVLSILAAVAAVGGAGAPMVAQSGRARTRLDGGDRDVERSATSRAWRPGSIVELKGTLSTDAPLKGEFSERDCVYYRALVEREVERVNRDSDGTSRTERVFETVTSTERHAPCRLEDASGSVAIDFTGAKVEAIEVAQTLRVGRHAVDGRRPAQRQRHDARAPLHGMDHPAGDTGLYPRLGARRQAASAPRRPRPTRSSSATSPRKSGRNR